LIDHIERLSKLSFVGEERESIRKDLQNILQLVETISQLDTSGVEPLIHMTDESNHFRLSESNEHISAADALRNAPKADSDYFRVPRFVDK